MGKTFVWKAELKFEGTVEEFNQMAASLEKLPVAISIPEWENRLDHVDGCFPIAVNVLLGDIVIKELAADMPRVMIKYVDDIRGGIRTPHLHLVNDEIVLLNRAKFKAFVGKVAHVLAERRAETVRDYVTVLDPINRLYPVYGRLGQTPAPSGPATELTSPKGQGKK